MQETLTKQELIKNVAAELGFTQADVSKVYTALAEHIDNAVRNGQSVRIPVLGTLKVKQKEAASRFIPSLGEEKEIPAHYCGVLRVKHTI